MRPLVLFAIPLLGRSTLVATIIPILTLALQACTLSSRVPEPAKDLGKPITLAAMEALLASDGPIEANTIVSTEWQVPLGGLLNLKSEQAQKAGLKDKAEPIQIYTHLLNHPSFGTFFIDTGSSQQVLDQPAKFGINWLIRQVMPLDQLKIKESMADTLKRLSTAPKAVFFTHMHIDHIGGVPDLPNEVTLYAGKAELTTRNLTSIVVQGATDGLLAGKLLRELPFETPAPGALTSIIDVFSDGSFFAIYVPGHTPGSTAYIARTKQGPILFVGDTSHTAWGWQNGVEPGSYTEDQALNRSSLLALVALAKRHPKMHVKLGHQGL